MTIFKSANQQKERSGPEVFPKSPLDSTSTTLKLGLLLRDSIHITDERERQKVDQIINEYLGIGSLTSDQLHEANKFCAKVYKKLAGEAFKAAYESLIDRSKNTEKLKQGNNFFVNYRDIQFSYQEENELRDLHDLTGNIFFITLKNQLISRGRIDESKNEKLLVTIKLCYKILLEDEEMGKIDINSLLNELRVVFNSEMKDKEIEFSIETTEETPYVFGNYVELQRVLANLIKNAKEILEETDMPDANIALEVLSGSIDISQLGQETQNSVKKIKLSVQTDEDKVIIKCHDNGPKMSDEKIDRIRSALKEPNTGELYTTKPGGSGRGTRIVANNVHKLGGSVDLENDEAGTTFTITLPKLVAQIDESN